MSRIRSIKPEFFTSDDIVSLKPLSRLFYASLWIEADREGRLVWSPRTLKNRYFPDPEDPLIEKANIEEMADELLRHGHLKLYRVGSKTYGYLPTFLTHQVINNREAQSVLPAYSPEFELTRESGVQGEGKEGRKGKEGKEGTHSSRETETGLVPAGQASAVEPFFVRLRKAFQQVTPIWPKPEQEIEDLKWLSEAFATKADPEQAAMLMLRAFYKLKKSGDAFWVRQPFTPHMMRALWGHIEGQIELEAGAAVDLSDTSWMDEEESK